ncbi:hypothetical protein VNI00_006317 [Paramarasmius palmivorus]|uniref:Nephrocystin 3-like N-terminal domain-containing protein n=1 Tax=Paramarasmius palmivorus TaxID=297713 RepID=A0AAW0D576_9AGAR
MSFNSPKDFTIHGGAYNTVNGPQTIQNITQSSSNEDILRLLATYAAINATSDAEARYPPPNCHPNTRVSTLQRLSQWIQDKSSTTKVFWVYGAAGVGKSAIAQKTVEDHRDRVVGTFFFSRNDSTRDKLRPFVATLAYQCCTLEPLKSVVGPLIIGAICSNPTVFQSTSEAQIQKLLLEPFSQIQPSEWEQLPDLIIVDGLDECIDPPSQERLLTIIDLVMFFAILKPFPFRFLLFSRSEPQIRHGIGNAHFASVLERIEVSATTVRFTRTLTDSDLDIQKYLLEKFNALRKKYHTVLRHEGEAWPNEAEVMSLVKRASGQFIFAATVIKYIDTPDERPQDRLKRILRMDLDGIQDSRYLALDMLYRQILSSCLNWDKVSPILRLLVTRVPDMNGIMPSLPWPSLKILTELFQLQLGEVEMLLSKLYSVIHVPEDIYTKVHILHASFAEFLLDRVRAGNYLIQPYSIEEYYQLFAIRSLRMFSLCMSRYPPYCPSGQPPGAGFLRRQGLLDKKYSDIMWSGTSQSLLDLMCLCRRIKTPSVSLLAELDNFEPCHTIAMIWEIPCSVLLGRFLMARFREWLRWAKSLEGPAPQEFIERVEAFFDGFYIGYARNCPRRLAINDIFTLESHLHPINTRHCGDIVNDFIFSCFNPEWLGPGGRGYTDTRLLLPTTSDPSMILPNDWIVVHVTKANADILVKVRDIYKHLEEDAQKVFHDDIIHDTSKSVHLNLVKEEDLAAFKKLLYERRDLLENLPRPQPPPSSSPLDLSNNNFPAHNVTLLRELRMVWHRLRHLVISEAGQSDIDR